MRTRVMAIAVSIVAVLGAALLIAPPAQAATGPASTVFSLTNAQRVKSGAKPLISDPALDAAAGVWARYLANTCSFKHSSSSWRASRTAKAGWTATGENIAAGQTSASAAVSAWMGSSGHRKNILNRTYTGMGVGYAASSCGYRHYWVQIFGVGKTAGPAGAGDLNGDITADVLGVDATNRLIAYLGSGTGGWRGSAPTGTSWASGDEIIPLGDFSGDSMPDVGRITSNGDFQLYRSTGSGGFATPVKIGNGWGAFTKIIGGVDFSGDGRTDVIARTPRGDLLMYRGNGLGGWQSSAATKIGNGWASMTSLFYAGDFNGDGEGDLIARQANNTLWIYPTNGRGGWGTPRQIGNGWGGFSALFSPGDFDRSGTSDVLARRQSDGALILYRGNGRGGWGAYQQIGWNWAGLRQLG